MAVAQQFRPVDHQWRVDLRKLRRGRRPARLAFEYGRLVRIIVVAHVDMLQLLHDNIFARLRFRSDRMGGDMFQQ